MRRILCIDMDAFFASVEQASRPYLRGKPIAVAGKSVILSPSYEARKYGVKTGSSIWEAKKLCPHIEIVKASNQKYIYVSSRIAEFLTSVTPKTIIYSIDEAFMDISGLEESSESIGYKIKNWIKNNLNVTGSVGIGSSYIVAKMGTKINKPDGYHEVPKGMELCFIDKFKLGDLWGIGKRTVFSLNSMGLYTPADVRDYGEEKLHKLWGIRGQTVYRLCSGIDSRPLKDNNSEYKSMSRSTTAPRNIYKLDEILAYLLQLSEAVSYKARTLNYAGKCITLFLRTSEWESFSFHQNIGFFTSATHHIYETVKKLYLTNMGANCSIRLFGVGLEKLKKGAELINMDDMLKQCDDKYINLYKAIDSINNKHSGGVMWGSGLLSDFKGGLSVISPARPESILDYEE